MNNSSPESNPVLMYNSDEPLPNDTHALFVINAKEKRVQVVRKTSRVYQTLRDKPHVTGSKQACDEVAKCIFD
jgi:hypothetical protein